MTKPILTLAEMYREGDTAFERLKRAGSRVLGARRAYIETPSRLPRRSARLNRRNNPTPKIK